MKQDKINNADFEIELLRNNEWYKIKQLLERLGFKVDDLGNDSAVIKYHVYKEK